MSCNFALCMFSNRLMWSIVKEPTAYVIRLNSVILSDHDFMVIVAGRYNYPEKKTHFCPVLLGFPMRSSLNATRYS